jgi:hypothetical protein
MAFGGFFHALNIISASFLLAGVWIGFYFAGAWVTTSRRDELDRKFPISGNELRRRRNAFYDRLASQPRRDIR